MITKGLILAGAITTLGAASYLTGFPRFFNSSLKLIEVKALTKDTNLFKFGLSNPNSLNGIGYATALLVKAPNGDLRPFTVVNNDEKGYVQLAIKNYNRSASGSITKMKPGDSIKVFGPLPSVGLDTKKHDQVYLIGAGAGITPLWSYLNGILNDQSSTTKIKLIYCNKSSEDVMFHDDIKYLKLKYPSRFEFVNVLETKDDGGDYSQTRISKEILAKELNPTESLKDPKILVCGPPKFIATVAGPKKQGPPIFQGTFGGVLKELGFKKEQVVKY